MNYYECMGFAAKDTQRSLPESKECVSVTGFCANKATAVFMEIESRKIIHMEISDWREVERKSPRMERYLVTKGLRYIVNGGFNIVELVSDASSTIIKILGEIELLQMYSL
ncbi:hypothetical protein SNE40_015185 [Patella caerulea]|uniref:Uncharacterized protein n=1 Tax=Patella caerulea TaxID=87958 RepID=A0AAN8JLN1_PATCE